MKFDLSQPGLYYLLNTPEVQAELKKLKLEDKASFEKKPDTDLIARMMARAISDEVEKCIADKLKAEAANLSKPEDWIHIALKDLPEAIELKSAALKTIPADEPVIKQVLKEIKLLPEASDTERPTTELTESELIVPNGRSPQLGNEIERELRSCESADWLVSFIKLKAIRAFYPQLQQFCGKANADGSLRLRIATTTYMGATDVEALKLLFSLPNTQVKVCFNTSQKRLHAKSQNIFHWESPNNTTLISDPGKRYVSDDYTKMLFVRQSKKRQMDITGAYPIGNQTSNYIFLGPVKRVLSHEGECPIGIDYELQHPIPADVYEYARGA